MIINIIIYNRKSCRIFSIKVSTRTYADFDKKHGKNDRVIIAIAIECSEYLTTQYSIKILNYLRIQFHFKNGVCVKVNSLKNVCHAEVSFCCGCFLFICFFFRFFQPVQKVFHFTQCHAFTIRKFFASFPTVDCLFGYDISVVKFLKKRSQKS